MHLTTTGLRPSPTSRSSGRLRCPSRSRVVHRVDGAHPAYGGAVHSRSVLTTTSTAVFVRVSRKQKLDVISRTFHGAL